MSGIPEELVARMHRAILAYVREDSSLIVGDNSIYAEFCSIVEQLPEPVDPDMVAAREVVCGYHHDKHPESPWHVEQSVLVRSGRFDNMLDVQAAYHGIKRGRELARGSSNTGGGE
jgi:hypothetical protein